MEDVQKLRSDLPAVTPGTPDTVDQDALYARVAAQFGPPLARLAAAYETDPSRQQDLLQEIHFSLWRSFATFRNQCSLRTWVYQVAHNTSIDLRARTEKKEANAFGKSRRSRRVGSSSRCRAFGGRALALPGFALLLVGYVDNGVPWTASVLLGGLGLFGGVAVVIHGKILAGRWQEEINFLQKLRTG
jgi:sigma-70-like protein